MILSPSISTEDTPSPSGQASGKNTGFISALSERTHIFDSFSKGLLRNGLRLLVAISGMLSGDDHQKLGPLLWQDCLDEPDHEVQASVSLSMTLDLQAYLSHLYRLPSSSCDVRNALRTNSYS